MVTNRELQINGDVLFGKTKRSCAVHPHNLLTTVLLPGPIYPERFAYLTGSVECRVLILWYSSSESRTTTNHYTVGIGPRTAKQTKQKFAGPPARRRVRSSWRYFVLRYYDTSYLRTTLMVCGQSSSSAPPWMSRKAVYGSLKASENAFKISLHFWRPFDSHNGPPKLPKWSQNGANIDWKNRSTLRSLL